MTDPVAVFLGNLHVRTAGRLASDWRPTYLVVGQGLVVSPPAATVEEWIEKFGPPHAEIVRAP